MTKYLIRKFPGAYFFYSYVGHKILYGILLSILVGLLDGFGLTMFLPLLQMADSSSAIDTSQLGKLSFLIDFLIANDVPMTISAILSVMILFFVFKGVMAFFQFYYRVSLQEQLLRRLRLEFIKGVTSLSYPYFTSAESGRIQNTLTTEVERVTRAYQSYFMIIQNLVMVFVYLGFAFFVNTQFAILVTIGGLLTSVVYKRIYKTTKNTSRAITNKLSDMQGLVYQLIQNFKYLKATDRMSGFAKSIQHAAVGIEKDNKKVGVLMAMLNASREPLVIVVVACIIYLQTSVFSSSLAPILVSLLFFYRALSFLMQMQSHSNYYLSVSGSIQNMMEFKTELNRNREISGDRKFQGLQRNLVLKNASLSIGGKSILKDIDLTIGKNETVAIVGESGSGKTTLMNIITGIASLEKGEFLIDGVNINQIDKQSYRDKIGYITQDPVVFTDTIYNNITFWDGDGASMRAQFDHAINIAACSAFISQLPEKEHTVLGLNGMNLSGGQRQRISIARELYRQVDLLLLDEATSALDSETEREIQENIDRLKGKYTIVIIAHRLSTIKNADKVILMKNGGIEAIGTFRQLVSESRSFERMVELQAFA